LGYVSADFRHHSVAYFMEGILEHHDRSGFEVYGYYNHVERDEFTQRLRSRVDRWVECAHLSDEELAERIRGDGIDVLVDLSGHTEGNRLLTFARRAAPVQVTYLGYPGTTGLRSMDYRLCTWETDPQGQEAFHSERLYRLARTLWCYRPLGERVARRARGPGRVRFGSMNNLAKLSEETVRLWGEILRGLPGSELVLTGLPEGSARTGLRERFMAQGVSGDRIVCHGRLGVESYRAVLGEIDVALDPYPYNGTTTTCETLWAGVPVVNLRGESSVSRSGYALLRAVGLEGLSAESGEEYVRTALELGQDGERLERLRGELPDRFEGSALRDEAGFTRELEQAFRHMWRA
jgi:predicted O-linked N-acetylglucosamine transferase (SPINDLY family)